MLDRNINRLFTFGCSFTKFVWETWPGILAYELDVPLYNYGQSGGGNLFISNTVSQADSFYKFNEKDLIIVAWSNVCREDKWINGWKTPGNIYTQNVWPKEIIETTDPAGCLVRDIGLIHLTKGLLENTKCQWYFLSMNNIINDLAQCSELEHYNFGNTQSFVKDVYHHVLKDIRPSFYEILWQNNLDNKINQNKKICPKFFDLHPFPSEHCKYLNGIFPDLISDSTIAKVEEKNCNLIDTINSLGDFNLYDTKNSLYEISCIKKSLPIKMH